VFLTSYSHDHEGLIADLEQGELLVVDDFADQ